MSASGRMLLLAALAVGLPSQVAAVGRDQASVTPVQKVINMLSDMLAKGKNEKEDEVVMFSTYQQFCVSTRKEKESRVKKEKEMIEKFAADIAKAGSEILATTEAIAVHDKDLAAWGVEKETATTARKQEETDYKVEYNDYTASIDSVERAKATVGAGSDTSLVQVQGAVRRVAELGLTSLAAKQAMQSFMQTGESDLEALLSVAAPEAKQYESSSGGVMGIIAQMGENFEEKRTEIEKEEMTKKFAFDQIMQELTSTITDAQREREEKAARSQDLAQAKADAEGELQKTKDDLAADDKFLSDLNVECQTKAEDYEKRQVVRAAEIEALSKAIEIMSGAAVAAGTDHLPSLVQGGASFVQLRSNAVSPAQKNAAAFLAERAKVSNSRLLALVALRIQADPFKKVTKMIKEMIEKLMTEGNEESEHKGFCDTEMGTNKQTRDQKTDEVDSLTATEEKLTADIKLLAEEVAVLGDEISVIDAQVTKATAERTAEKEKNTVTIRDAKGGQQATVMALGVLREFYGKAAEAAAFAQFESGARVPGAPDTGDATYTGMGSSSGGVVGMLEVIESDFARLDAETTASEAEAEGAYNKFMTDSQKDKSVKTADMTYKSNDKTKAEADLLETGKDLKTTKEELAAAMEYFDKLKPSCVEAGVSYEDRVAARKQEIESLKEALQILG